MECVLEGRIIHHLYQRLSNYNDTILFVGYQAFGTRGRRILEGEPTIRIFGQDIPLNCQVRQITGLSAHSDQSELLRWLDGFENSPDHIFITHGEPDSSYALADKIRQTKQWEPTVPGIWNGMTFIPPLINYGDLFS